MPVPANVLVCSGHDPSGGAGFQADVEAISAQGAHAAGVLTALTRQDTRNAYAVAATADDAFAATLDTLLADMHFSAVKIGLVGSPGQAGLIAERIQGRAGLPLVVDPVLRAGGGATLAADPVAHALTEHLFPMATLLTPNAAEARLLCAGEPDLETCGARLSQQAAWVLITGGDEAGDSVINTLYHRGAVAQRYSWPRLAGPFHGAGCTLAAAAAARLARGDSVPDAVAAAQRYTHECLTAAFAPGGGQCIPQRLGGYRA